MEAAARSNESGPDLGASSLLFGGLGAGSDHDVFRLILPDEAELRISSRDGSTDACSGSLDTVLTLRDAGGSRIEANDDEPGTKCSMIERLVPAGTWFIEVEPYTALAAAESYSLAVVALPRAKLTGVSPASPAADPAPHVNGSATAGATVAVFTRANCEGPAAGTGTAADLAGAGIQVSIGDNRARSFFTRATLGTRVGRCNASGLRYVSTSGRPGSLRRENERPNEVGANDTRLLADAVESPVPVGSVIAGTLFGPADVDVLRMTVPAEQVVRVAVYDETAADCPVTGADPRIRVLGADGAVLGSDDDSGIANCSTNTLELPAGTFYVEISQATGSARTFDYSLALTGPTETIDEPEGTAASGNNDSAATAGVIRIGAVARGAIGTPSDADWYTFTTTAMRSIRAETIEGQAGASCESGLLQTKLELFRSGSTVPIASDQTGGRGSCSRIDGEGSSPRDAGAYDLPPGTYHLRVTSTAGMFDYRVFLSAS